MVKRNTLAILCVINFYFAIQPPHPPVGQGLLIHEISRSYSTTQHSR